MSTNYSDTEIHKFIKSYVKSKDGKIAQQSDEVFTVTYPNEENPKKYTYQPALAREKKIPLITPGSATFQQILKECLENGVLCQILLKPKGEIEIALKGYFKDVPFSCENCDKVAVGEEVISTCTKSPPCFHMINNGKIASVKIVKNDPVRYFQFYFSATFQNKLRPKNEETITILLDEEGNVVNAQDFNEDVILKNEAVEIQDFKSKLDAAVFDKLKTAAEEKLGIILKEKLVPFDLSLSKEKKSKLRSFDKRLRRERREKVISRKHDFDIPQWRASYEALLKREEESLITNIAVKLINLLVINTAKIRFELNLDNNSTIRSSLVLGVNHASDVTCPVCKKNFSEGYATQDSLYVCKNCTRQSVDTTKIYSKKAALTLDETLNEYFEHDSGFVCSICGKRHSRLLEFKCSHDNSSVCIHHYGLCDVCGKVFSKLNLTYTDEFKRQLCAKHASKNKAKDTKMRYLKLNGVVEEISKRYPNIDIAEFLQEKLQIPDYKAEELAARIDKEYFQKVNKSEQNCVEQFLEKSDESELSKTSVYSVDSLSEREFERFTKWLLEELGYEIHPEKYSVDSGVYLVATKDDKKLAILTKKTSRNSKVSNSVILKSQEATSTYGCTGAIVLTASYFTQQAIVDAQKFHVDLWDRDTIDAKITEVRKKAELEEQTCFPTYKGSLLQSLLRLEETKDFIIESKPDAKYDFHLPGVKYPLLTFQAQGNDVVRCVFRIKYNEPVGEFNGEAIISTDSNNNRFGPDGEEAYLSIIKYLEQFVE